MSTNCHCKVSIFWHDNNDAHLKINNNSGTRQNDFNMKEGSGNGTWATDLRVRNQKT
jgi:hypothetical protein